MEANLRHLALLGSRRFGPALRWYGECECRWAGPTHGDWAAAFIDAVEHVAASMVEYDVQPDTSV